MNVLPPADDDMNQTLRSSLATGGGASLCSKTTNTSPVSALTAAWGVVRQNRHTAVESSMARPFHVRPPSVDLAKSSRSPAPAGGAVVGVVVSTGPGLGGAGGAVAAVAPAGAGGRSLVKA